ncbi:acetyl-CoA hydrolase/transferase C-terminal domain-containing protein [Natronomonas salsuginis]|uniref:Uncharacterized protein n=1 Tax=Natronomonas salsuginis TaxID=2217661 RepID=A0A4U5JA33_9EURY|nr:acetyl-CoA hydrolase/transferase C-terminal domain-containing protein [Natronomonas salsuginis]TKR25036.1 hypothetical protein DM868_11740 [Natronomonas salsuginis]
MAELKELSLVICCPRKYKFLNMAKNLEDFELKDNDLLLTRGPYSGELFRDILDSNANATALIMGPTLDREGGFSIKDFAEQSNNIDVILTSPRGDSKSAYDDGTVDFMPVKLNDYPGVIKKLAHKNERTVGILETTQPSDGKVYPGISAVAVPEIIEAADVLVAEMNELQPKVNGLSYKYDIFDYVRECSVPLPKQPIPEPDDSFMKIGENIANLIPDTGTIQIGFGKIPNAIGQCLTPEKNLGLHSGLVTPVIKDLIERDIITKGSGVLPSVDDCPLGSPGLTIAALGDSQEFYEWLENTNYIELRGMEQTHDPQLVSTIDDFVAINSGVEVDLNGQVNGERINGQQIAGPGGQPIFFNIARKSKNGKAIIALPSQTNSGYSKIVSGISKKNIVTTPRYNIDYVVTEQGTADVQFQTEKESTQQILQVAHPEHRDRLKDNIT